MDDITIRKLTEDDYEQLLKIRKPEDVHHGWDYLPDYFLTLINMPEITGYGSFYQNKMIGSVFAHRVDDGKTFVIRGARVSEDYVGMGVFRTLRKYLQSEHVTHYNTLHNALTFNNEAVDMIEQVKNGHYNLILEKNILAYRATKDDLISLFNTQNKNPSLDAKLVHKHELENELENEIRRKKLFPDHRLVVDWVPFRPIKSNVSQILTDRCRCVGTNIGMKSCDIYEENRSLLSFGNFANCKNGLLYRIDIYGDGFEHIEKHFALNIKRMIEMKQADIILEVFCYKEMDIDYCDSVLSKFGFRKFKFHETKQYCAEKLIID